MQSDDTSLELAREIARPPVWTVQALLDKLPGVRPSWIRDAVNSSCEDRPLLEHLIVKQMEDQIGELARLYLGLVLFFLNHPVGKSAFMDALRSTNTAARQLVLAQFQIIHEHDFGPDGEALRLPISRAEVCAAILPLLQDPTSNEGAIALSFAVQWKSFPFCRSQLQPLQGHPEFAVRAKVLNAFVGSGNDDGALARLAAELLAPAVPPDAQSPAWQNAMSAYCRSLKSCAEYGKDGDIRLRAGMVALQVLQAGLHRDDLSICCGPDGGWHDEDALLQAVVLARPSGAQALLQRLVASKNLPVRVRSFAALRHVDLTGHAAEGTGAVIGQMLEQPALDSRGLLAEFVQRSLAGMDVLVLAARHPGWCAEAAAAIAEYPRGREDRLAVQGLIAALQVTVTGTPGQHPHPELVKTLQVLPRTEEDNLAIVSILREALEHAQRVSDQPWLAQTARHHLLMFGDMCEADDRALAPWDAMSVHWQRNAIRWAHAVDLLVDAGAMDPLDEASIAELDSADDPAMVLLGALYENGGRAEFANIRDDGYETDHHRAFGKLASIVRPTVLIEALSQSFEHHWEVLPDSVKSSLRTSIDGFPQPLEIDLIANVPLVSAEETICLIRFVHQDQVYRFLARPEGTWMDLWAVIDAFNRFMDHIGRAEQAYWLADGPSSNGEWAFLICAHRDRMADLVCRLRLPLHPRVT